VMVGMGRGAEHGILFKSSEALQRVGDVTHVVFDKTSTVTAGQLSVSDVITTPALDRRSLLRLAATAESGSEPPLAAAIVAAAKSESISWDKPEDFVAVVGHGVTAQHQRQ